MRQRIARTRGLRGGVRAALAAFVAALVVWALPGWAAAAPAQRLDTRVGEQHWHRTCGGGTDLRFAEFAGSTLAGSDFADADLTGADFAGANLVDADFRHACLIDTYLAGATLTRADFTGADLTDANLLSSNLVGADFTGAILTDANLDGSIIADTIFTGAIGWKGPPSHVPGRLHPPRDVACCDARSDWSASSRCRAALIRIGRCLLSRSVGAVAQVGAGAVEDFVGEGGVGVGDGT
jgi:hypothetical protein